MNTILLLAQIAIGSVLAGGILLVVGLAGTVLWLRHRVRQRIAMRIKSGRASRRGVLFPFHVKHRSSAVGQQS
jgi:hypothetical protein